MGVIRPGSRGHTRQFIPEGIYSIYISIDNGDGDMTANSRVAQWGTSLAIRIPKPLGEELKLQEGTAVELSAQDGQLTIARKELDIEDNTR